MCGYFSSRVVSRHRYVMTSANVGSWFRVLFGFDECGVNDGEFTRDNYLQTQQHFSTKVDANGNIKLMSNVNHREFHAGKFSTPSLAELRSLVSTRTSGNLTFSHIVIGDALLLHSLHSGATFQAASQFNCLEFPSPDCIPENGVSMYAYDNTQGPACAMACAAGTVYRNYFVNPSTNGPGEVGQSVHSQINNLDDLEALLNNEHHQYFSVRNGYTFSDLDSLSRLNATLKNWEDQGRWNELMGAIKIGLHENVGVTFATRFRETVCKYATYVM